MKTLRKSLRSTTNALALAAGLLAGALALPTHVLAQAANPSGSASDKIQYYTDAITAEQSGDYAKAKDLLGKIIAMDPTDSGNKEVEAHIALLDRAIAEQANGKPTLFASNSAAASAAVVAPIAVTQLPSDAVVMAATPMAAAPGASPSSPAAPAPARAPAPSAEAAAALKIQAQKQQAELAAIRKTISDARSLENAGQYDDARAKLAQAQQQLPQSVASLYVGEDIKQEIAATYFNQAVDHYDTMAYSSATDDLASYRKAGGDPARARSLENKIASALNDPMRQDPSVVAPKFEATQDSIKLLLVRGESEYILGDYNDALQTFDTVVTNDPNNVPAQAYEKKINDVLFASSSLSHDSTRSQFLKEVNDDWRLPSVYQGAPDNSHGNATVEPEIKKLGEIIVPLVDIDIPTPLDEVVATFTMLSQKYDKEGKGLNFHVLPPPNGVMPKVKLEKLRDLSLARLLDLACRDVGYGFFDDKGIIEVSQGSGSAMGMTGQFDIKSFPMTESTLTRLGYITGSSDSSSSSSSSTPFSSDASGGSANGTAAPSSDSSGTGPAPNDVEQRLTDFFQRAGIDFPSGAKIAYTPGEIIVTNTPRNLQTLGDFLIKYSSVKQAEIEARFLDVQEGDLQEFGANWNVAKPGSNTQLFQTSAADGSNSNLRNLGSAFPLGNNGAQPTVVTGLSTSQSITSESEIFNATTGTDQLVDSTANITVPLPNLSIPQSIPTLPNEINVGGAATDLFSGVLGYIQGYKINAMLNALSQKQGSDLMSAPKIVCMTEHDANITIAQQLLYPQTFSPIQSAVSPASGAGGTASGSGGVTITAGTPNGFVTANIGVTMSVVPKIYDDDTIELNLSPVVTEFEGFIEYGGTSLAIQAGTTASVPSGFIQPIFDVRLINTDVTIFDGATVVLGGLTRDEVKTVDDKVPILGDIPLIGRFFQSKGESSQKRNLMIFVTANIISPGGAPANQSIANITPGSVFQNPTIVTPGRSIPRVPENALGAASTTTAAP